MGTNLGWRPGYRFSMDPLSAGIDRTLRGLRTGDRNALFGGLGLLMFVVWRKRRQRPRDVITRETVRPGETLVIRGTRLGAVGRKNSPLPPVQTL